MRLRGFKMSDSQTLVAASTEPTMPRSTNRLMSVDAYRGFVMLLMLGEVLRWEAAAEKLPSNAFLAFMAYHQSHVSWQGCSLLDLIQPSFTFLVGVAMPFSLASRAARGQSNLQRTLHALGRAFVLTFLGVFLRSLGRPITNFTFEDTLSQIGMGYAFLYGIAHLSRKAQWCSLGIILVGYWAAFALTPLPAAGFDPVSVGVKPDWDHHVTGFAAHWDKNTNLAMQVEIWFRNLFPNEKPFLFNSGGYATLSFIPTLGTMILGLLTGTVLRNQWTDKQKVKHFLIMGGLGLSLGMLLDVTGICPVVKRIWTPSWVLLSGGWCSLLLAMFYTVIDVKGYKKMAFPLVVVGLNSIAAYVMSSLVTGQIEDALYRHFGHTPFLILGDAMESVVHGGVTLALVWGILYWMQKRGLFLRI